MKPQLGRLLAVCCLAFFMLGALMPLPAGAQVAGATLSGTITDAQGGAIPNAKVSARNVATGVSTQSTTNATGFYAIVNLLPGDYEVNVSAAGFNTIATKVTLTVGANQELSTSLQVGQVTQEVQVTGVAPIVETTNATLSGQVEATQIVQLPLNGRDWASLATLEPGVASVRPHEEVTAPGGSTRGLGMQMTINGARPQQNVYRLNGVIVNDYSNAGPGNVLGANAGVDAIQEFTVLTSNYSAEYGFTSGGVINAITRSGTNTLHGSVYEFVRNSAFDSADFFENSNGVPKGAFRRNQFGASTGWKVLKDRFFLFGDYEGLRQSKAVPQLGAVLTANARLGIINGSNGNPLPPLVGPCVPAAGQTMTNRAPGRANVCVDDRIFNLIDPAGTPAGRLWPLPNGPVLAPGNAATFFSDGAQIANDNYGTVRGDLKISDKDSLSGSWYRDTSTWKRPNLFNETLTGFQVPHGAYTLEETHILSTAMVNTVRLGLNQSDLFSPAFSDSNPVSHDTTLGVLPGCVAPAFSIGGNGNSGNSTPVTGAGGFTGAPGFSSRTKKIEVFDDLARTIGKHDLKFGFMYLGDHENWLNGPAGCSGSSSFSSIQNFLQNIPNRVRMPVVEPFTPPSSVHHYRSHIFGGYIQDDWKMRSNLTVNLGLRYQVATIPTEVDDKINNLETLWQDPGTCSANPFGVGVCPGFYHQTFQRNPTLKNFEPRIGFAWDPFRTGKTSVRGGFGIFDVEPLSYMFALNSLQTAPNGAEVDLSSPGQGTYPQGFAAASLNPNVASLAAAAARWGFIEPFPKRNYVMQWNFNVQRQITATTSVTLAYAGSRGIHNPFQTDDLNTVFPTLSSAGWLFPDPIGSGCLTAKPTTSVPNPPICGLTDVALGLPATFSTNPTGIVPGLLINPHVSQVQSTIFQASSWYNALQAVVAKRMSHGLQLQGSFTWGKSIDTTSSSFAGDNYSNNPSAIVPWWDPSSIKGLSDFNVTRNLVINALWQIPTPASFNKPIGWIARGWGLGAVFEASDGIPLWPLSGLDADALGQLNGGPYDIPDVVSGCNLTNPSAGRHGGLQYINPSCFIVPVAPNQSFATANCDQNPPFGSKGAPLPLATLIAASPAHVSALSCYNLMGNLGRNTVIGPGLLNLDMSMTKDNYIRKISEAFNIQFRAEFFNVLNRTNFAPPITNNLGSLAADGTVPNNFGVITKTQVPMREIQFALKMIW
jgi:carboxypeptidase family protein